MHLGLALSLCSQRPTGGAATFDPATLALTGWWRASYAGTPWVGTASAGTSGSRNASEATNAPAVGTALNGYDTADFEEADFDYLDTATVGTLFTAAAGSCAFLIRAESVRADQAAAYDESAIWLDGSTQTCGLFIAASGVRAGGYNGGWNYTAYQALATSTWGLAQMRWNGTNLESRVNGGAWQTVACGNLTTSGMVQLGRNSVNAAGYFDGLMAEVMTAASRLSDDDFDDIRSYVNARYGLSL